MFTGDALLALRRAEPFVPFRFHLSDGRTVDVPAAELVLPCRHCAVVGIPDPRCSDRVADGWTTVWYGHVSRVEMLAPENPPAAWTPAL